MPEPNRINLRNGGYLLFDYFQNEYRIAIYTRKISKGANLEQALVRALDEPPWTKRVQDIHHYIKSVDKYEYLTLD